LEDSAPDEIILTNRRIREPYVRWCERTGSELIATFLLDCAIVSAVNLNALNRLFLQHQEKIKRKPFSNNKKTLYCCTFISSKTLILHKYFRKNESLIQKLIL
jgi:hypothetical protein